MKHENHAEQITSLKRQLRFHHRRRKQVVTDPELTTEDRTRQLTHHDRVIHRLSRQLRSES